MATRIGRSPGIGGDKSLDSTGPALGPAGWLRSLRVLWRERVEDAEPVGGGGSFPAAGHAEFAEGLGQRGIQRGKLIGPTDQNRTPHPRFHISKHASNPGGQGKPGPTPSSSRPACEAWCALDLRSGGRGEDLHEMAVGVTEVRAPAVAAAVDLAGFSASGVGEEGDVAGLDAGEGGVEFLVADQEGVVV